MSGAFPFPCETARLLIRPPQLGDLEAVLAAIEETRAQLRRWMDWARRPEKEMANSEEEYLRQSIHQWRERRQGRPADPLPLHLFRRADGAFLGTSGFHDCVWEIPRLELGYWLRASAQGQGYMTEAVIAISEAAFAAWGLRRLSIHCEATNDASIRVAERAGFAREARLRQHRLSHDGSVQDTLIYARYAGGTAGPAIIASHSPASVR